MPDSENILGKAKEMSRAGMYSDAESILTPALELAERLAAAQQKSWGIESGETGSSLDQTVDEIAALSTRLGLNGLIKTASRYDPRAIFLNERGFNRRMLGNYDGALIDYDAALNSRPDNEQSAVAWINKADIYRVGKKDFGQAHLCLDEALLHIRPQPLRPYLDEEWGALLHAKAVDQRGLVLAGQGDNASAITVYKHARDICEMELKHRPDHADLHNRYAQTILHLGNAYIQLKDHTRVEEAYQCLTTAFDLFTKHNDQNGIVNAVMAMGRIAAIKKDYTDAIVHYTRALQHLNPEQDKRGVGVLSLHLTHAYMESREVSEGIVHLKKTIEAVLSGDITEHDRQILKEPWNRITTIVQNMLETHYLTEEHTQAVITRGYADACARFNGILAQ